jgi:hypothetical protein
MTRLESLYAEWDRVAAELLVTLEAERILSIERAERFSEATREAIKACDELLETIS